MLRSRVVLSVIALACGLSLSGVASADEYMYPSTDRGVVVAPGVYGSCYSVRGKHGHYYHHAICGMHRISYSCVAYELSVNPIHTDRVCTRWVYDRGFRVMDRAYVYK